MNTKRNLLTRSIGIVLCSIVVASGCKSLPKPNGSLKDTQSSISEQVKIIEENANGIHQDAQKVEEPTKSQIETKVETIQQSNLKIKDAAVEIGQHANVKNEDDKIIKRQNELIKKQEATIKRLEDEKYGLISKILAVIAGLSIIFSVASIFVLKSPRWAAFGGVLFSVCVAAQWLLNYALIIGLVTLAIIGVSAYFILRKERNATRDVVLTVEAIKPYVPTVEDFKTAANNIQSMATKKIVDTIKRKQL